jgi:hypothetical protein
VATEYIGPATFRTADTVFAVHAALSTDVSGGVYSWGGRLLAADVAAVNLQGQGGTLSVPEYGDSEVHVAVADLDSEMGGVLLRVTGSGRAPYEQDGDIVSVRLPDGSTIYQTIEV